MINQWLLARLCEVGGLAIMLAGRNRQCATLARVASVSPARLDTQSTGE